MSKSVLATIMLSVLILAGCESGKTALLHLPLDAATLSVAPVEQLTTAGGGDLVGQGHLGTALALFFPMDRIIDNSFMADINFNFAVHRDWSVELGAGWTKADVVDTGFSGELQVIPLIACGQYGRAFSDAGRAYGGIGLGWATTDFDGSGVTSDDALIVHFMAGVDIDITNILGLNVELRYQMANTDLSNGVTLDLDAFMFRVNGVWKF